MRPAKPRTSSGRKPQPVPPERTRRPNRRQAKDRSRRNAVAIEDEVVVGGFAPGRETVVETSLISLRLNPAWRLTHIRSRRRTKANFASRIARFAPVDKASALHRHHRSPAGIPSSTSTMRARVAGVVLIGQRIGSEEAVARRSRGSGPAASVCRKWRTTNSATWSRREARRLKKMPCRTGGAVSSIHPSSRSSRASASSKVSSPPRRRPAGASLTRSCA